MLGELNERERTILKILSERGGVSVSVLSAELGLSEVTIRSDLKALEEKGLLNRTRGGAAPAIHRDIVERQHERVE